MNDMLIGTNFKRLINILGADNNQEILVFAVNPLIIKAAHLTDRFWYT